MSPGSVEVRNDFKKQSIGDPIGVMWDGMSGHLVDGFGLCSVNRWPPSARAEFATWEAHSLCAGIYAILVELVQATFEDLRRSAFALALGHMKQSPFSEAALLKARTLWANLLPRSQAALHKHEGQPFYLELIAQSLRCLDDPDWMILTEAEESFASGVPLGYDEPLPRVPGVFPPKTKHRTC